MALVVSFPKKSPMFFFTDGSFTGGTGSMASVTSSGRSSRRDSVASSSDHVVVVDLPPAGKAPSYDDGNYQQVVVARGNFENVPQLLFSNPAFQTQGLNSENALLRSEIASLNQEMGQVLARAKNAEKGDEGE